MPAHPTCLRHASNARYRTWTYRTFCGCEKSPRSGTEISVSMGNSDLLHLLRGTKSVPVRTPSAANALGDPWVQYSGMLGSSH